jgi:hypothetical protein
MALSACRVTNRVGDGFRANRKKLQQQEIKIMKNLTKLALAAVILCSAVAANAQSYYSSTTYGYGSSYGNSCGSSSSYSQPRSSSYTATTYASPSYSSTHVSGYSGSTSVYGTSTQIGGTTFHNYSSSDGRYLSGTTTTIGNSSFTTLYGN